MPPAVSPGTEPALRPVMLKERAPTSGRKWLVAGLAGGLVIAAAVAAWLAIDASKAEKARDAWLSARVSMADEYARTTRCREIRKLRTEIAETGTTPPYARAVERVEEILHACKDREQIRADVAELPDFAEINATEQLRSMKRSFAACVPPRPKGMAFPDPAVRKCISQIGKAMIFRPSKQGGLATTTVWY